MEKVDEREEREETNRRRRMQRERARRREEKGEKAIIIIFISIIIIINIGAIHTNLGAVEGGERRQWKADERKIFGRGNKS